MTRRSVIATGATGLVGNPFLFSHIQGQTLRGHFFVYGTYLRRLQPQPRRAASIAAMSIFFICIIASNARLAAAVSGSVTAFVRAIGVICQDNPHLSLHQPHSVDFPRSICATPYHSGPSSLCLAGGITAFWSGAFSVGHFSWFQIESFFASLLTLLETVRRQWRQLWQ